MIIINWHKIKIKTLLLSILFIWMLIYILILRNESTNIRQTNLQDSEETNQEHQVNCAWAIDTSIKLIEDWVSYLNFQNDVLVEQWCPTISKDDIKWYPWELSDDWTHQELPSIEWDESHERFKSLANRYWLDAWMIWKYEHKWNLTEWVILCIAISETSWWKRWAWENNIWNVGNTDSNPRGAEFSWVEESLDMIWQTLNNKFLWTTETLGCLSNWWSCLDKYDKGKRYATSNGNWERNMVNCLETIYQTEINPALLSFRSDYVPLQVLK